MSKKIVPLIEDDQLSEGSISACGYMEGCGEYQSSERSITSTEFNERRRCENKCVLWAMILSGIGVVILLSML